MQSPLTRSTWPALVLLLLVLPTLAAAGVVIEFTGTVTAVAGDGDFFAVPDAGVGSSLTGVIEYGMTPDFIYDPYPGDCSMGYIFNGGTMTIDIAGYVWRYDTLAILLDDCEANDSAEFLGQGALEYPVSAPAHQLILKLFDQTLPYDLLSSLDLPLAPGDLALDEVTRRTGRILNSTYGEVRFNVESIRMTGQVAAGQLTWDSFKALFR